MMKKLIGGVKRAFSSGPSSRDSDSRSDDGSQDSAWSSSFVPSPHETGGRGRSTIFRMMAFLWPRMATTFPSVAPRRWRSRSLSASESLLTLMYTMWTCLRGLEWMKSFYSSSRLLVGENSMVGIGWLERWMDDFATVQIEIQASIDSQTSMMHDLFGHFRINPDASILQRFKLGGDAGCPRINPHLSHSIPCFSSYLITCLIGCTTVIVFIARMYFFQ
jgi:hypothetical protein